MHTVEPGIYFIPELIDLWKGEKKFMDFINYDKVEEYRNFGGIRNGGKNRTAKLLRIFSDPNLRSP